MLDIFRHYLRQTQPQRLSSLYAVFKIAEPFPIIEQPCFSRTARGDIGLTMKSGWGPLAGTFSDAQCPWEEKGILFCWLSLKGTLTPKKEQGSNALGNKDLA